MSTHLHKSNEQSQSYDFEQYQNPDDYAISFFKSISIDDKNRIGIIDNLIRYSPVVLKYISDSDVDQLNDDALKESLIYYLNTKDEIIPRDVIAPDNSTNKDFIRAWGSRNEKMLSSQAKIYSKLINDNSLLPNLPTHLKSKIISNMSNRKDWREVTVQFLKKSPYELMDNAQLIVENQIKIPKAHLARLLTAIRFGKLHPEINLTELNEINPYISSKYPEWFIKRGRLKEAHIRSVQLNPLTAPFIINDVLKRMNIGRNSHITDLIKLYQDTPLLHYISLLITEAGKTGKVIESFQTNKHGMSHIYMEDFISNKKIKGTIDGFANICYRAIKQEGASGKHNITDFINSKYPSMHHAPLDDLKIIADFSQNKNLQSAISDAEHTYFHTMSHQILEEINNSTTDDYCFDLDRVL